MRGTTVVLVHGNFLGPWSWRDVVGALDERGVHTQTPDLPSADPARQPHGDLYADAAAVRELLDSLPPPVLLCGHSYGGAVITEAAAGPHPAVRHLVYLAGAVPGEGESLASLAARVTVGDDAPGEPEAVRVRSDGMLELQAGAALHSLFHDCAAARAREAVDQLRPSSPATGGQPVRRAAWHHLPATFVRGRDDRTPELVSSRFFEDRVDVLELPTGHCPNWSRPDLVADLLVERAQRVSQ